MKYFISICFAVLLAFTGSIFAEDTISPGKNTQILRYKFRQGETISVQVSHRALTETTINGTTQHVETATDSTKSWKITHVDKDGRATLKHLVDHVKMMSRAGGMETVRWDSDGSKAPPDGYGGVQLGLGKPLSELTIDSCGRVINRKDFFPSPPSNTGDLMVVPLPDEPVATGTTWTVPDTIFVDIPGSTGKSVRTRLRYQVTKLKKDRAVIKVDTTVLTPVHDPQTESRLLERIWSGEIVFGIDCGRIISRSVSVDRRVIGFHGPASSIRYKASREEELVSD
ncbi:MAG: hypothetical protein HN703_05625 [Planctomycetaceae bacterium]|nr:hypothetical protein [Planctomycetaceae bacterium]